VLDRLLDRDVVEVAAADVAHGGEAGAQHLARVGAPDHCPVAVGVAQPVEPVHRRVGVEVDVHVDETGHQRLAGQVDVARTGRHGIALVPNGRDPAVGDHHLWPIHHPAGEHVHHPVGRDHNRVGLRFRCQAQHRCRQA
jgi:hypothetical protein